LRAAISAAVIAIPAIPPLIDERAAVRRKALGIAESALDTFTLGLGVVLDLGVEALGLGVEDLGLGVEDLGLGIDGAFNLGEEILGVALGGALGVALVAGCFGPVPAAVHRCPFHLTIRP